MNPCLITNTVPTVEFLDSAQALTVARRRIFPALYLLMVESIKACALRDRFTRLRSREELLIRKRVAHRRS